MKNKRKEGKLHREEFRRAVQMELKEHRSSFIVFSILRFLVIVCLVRQAFLHNYEGLFLSILTLLLLYIPSWIQVKLRIEIPTGLEIAILCFIFAAEILGEINAFYIMIPGWDTILHTLNGFLCAAIGFSLVLLLNNDERLTFELSPFFLALVAFCFSMTVGVIWEFFECAMDQFLRLDMQKDTHHPCGQQRHAGPGRGKSSGIHTGYCRCDRGSQRWNKAGAGTWRLPGHWSSGYDERPFL